MNLSAQNLVDKVKQLASQHSVYLPSWEGTLWDYLAIFLTQPKVARNAYQRMYDMIMHFGIEEYVDFKKPVIHYKFFDDPLTNGQDAVFGLDIPLMKLVNTIKAGALGYGPERRVILLHGPVGSSKSTICRLLKKGLEHYSRLDEGALYTFEWIDSTGELEDIFGKNTRVFPSPMHEEPLLLLPEPIREALLTEANANLKAEYRIQIEGNCAPSRFIFNKLMDRYQGDLEKVYQHVRVRRLYLSEADRIGIGTFQPKDEKTKIAPN